jgi:hypothetical protein
MAKYKTLKSVAQSFAHSFADVPPDSAREAHGNEDVPHELARRGRVQVFMLVAAFAIFMFGIDIALWIRTDVFHPITAFGRLAVTAGLGVLIVNVRSWARTVLGLWLGAISLTYVIGAAFTSGLGTLLSITMLIIAVAVGAGAVVLFSSGDIQQLIEDGARGKRASESSSAGG